MKEKVQVEAEVKVESASYYLTPGLNVNLGRKLCHSLSRIFSHR